MKKYSAVSGQEKAIIKSNMCRAMIDGIGDLSKRTGMKYQLIWKRLQTPSMLRLYELRAIISETNMPDEDILKIVRGAK